MKGKTFEIELENGEKKQATLITRIKPESKDCEYIYYAIEDEDNSGDEGTSTIYASKIKEVDGKQIIDNLDDEEERQYAYKVFSETYKKLRDEKQN